MTIPKRARLVHRDSNRRHLALTARIWDGALCSPRSFGSRGWWYATPTEASQLVLCGACKATLRALTAAFEQDYPKPPTKKVK